MEKKEFFDNLKQFQRFLKERKITCKEMAKRMGYSESYLNAVFNGKQTPSPRFTKLLFATAQLVLQKDVWEVESYSEKNESCISS